MHGEIMLSRFMAPARVQRGRLRMLSRASAER